MQRTKIALSLAVSAMALAAVTPVWAQDAQTTKEQQLEARLNALEQAVGSLRGELDATKAENAQLKAQQQQQQAALAAQAAAPATPPPAQSAEAKPQDGFTVGNGGTRIKVGGYVKITANETNYGNGQGADASTGAFIHDFYAPQFIPAGGRRSTTTENFSAKQTRLWLNLDSSIAGLPVKAYVETDFQTSPGTQGSDKATNGYNLALRQAWLSVGPVLIGQSWSSFLNSAIIPESTEYVGPPEGTVFVRQPQIRYMATLNKDWSLWLSVENPETVTSLSYGAVGTANPASAAQILNSSNTLPDFIARINYHPGDASISLAGLIRQLRIQCRTATDAGLGGASTCGLPAALGDFSNTATGYGFSFAAFVPNKIADIRFEATWGHGIGRYVGLAFAPDALVSADGQIHTTETFASFLALTHRWTSKLRSTVIGSYQHDKYPGGALTPLDWAAITSATSPFNTTGYSIAANLFWSPVKQVDLGAEYRYGYREMLNGLSGNMNRLELSAQYNF